MRHDLTDDDVLAFTLAGCNDVEIATFAGTGLTVARARMAHALREHAKPNNPVDKQEVSRG
jgi:uncharacterized membrane protein